MSSELRVETRVEPCDDILGACALDRRHHGVFVVHSRNGRPRRRCVAREFESEEILKAPASRNRHSSTGIRASSAPSTRMRPLVG